MLRRVFIGFILVIGFAVLAGCDDDGDGKSDAGDEGDSGTVSGDGGTMTDTSLPGSDTQVSNSTETGMETTNTDTTSVGDGGVDTSGDTEQMTDTAQGATDDLEIAGTYVTTFEPPERITISNTVWLSEADWGNASYAITNYDNEGNYLVAQNSADNAFNPNLWSRFEWVVSDTTLYYCQSLYDGATEADVSMTANMADAGDLSTGCGGFPWSALLTASDVATDDTDTGDGGMDHDGGEEVDGGTLVDGGVDSGM